jgi:hypothetical protein
LLQRLHHLNQLQRLVSFQTLFLPGHIHTPGLESSHGPLGLFHQPVEVSSCIFGPTTKRLRGRLLLAKTEKQEWCEKFCDNDSGQLSDFLDLQGRLVVCTICELGDIRPDRG